MSAGQSNYRYPLTHVVGFFYEGQPLKPAMRRATHGRGISSLLHCLGDRHGDRDRGSDHGIVPHAQEPHHLHMGWHRR